MPKESAAYCACPYFRPSRKGEMFIPLQFPVACPWLWTLNLPLLISFTAGPRNSRKPVECHMMEILCTSSQACHFWQNHQFQTPISDPLKLEISQSLQDSDFPVLKFKLVGQCSKPLHHCLHLDNMLPGHHHQEGAHAFDSLIAMVHLCLLPLALEEV